MIKDVLVSELLWMVSPESGKHIQALLAKLGVVYDFFIVKVK